MTATKTEVYWLLMYEMASFLESVDIVLVVSRAQISIDTCKSDSGSKNFFETVRPRTGVQFKVATDHLTGFPKELLNFVT